MNDNAIIRNQYDFSCQKSLVSTARALFQKYYNQVKQGMDEIETLNQDRQKQKKQVYRHQINRFSNLCKLENGLFRN